MKRSQRRSATLAILLALMVSFVAPAVAQAQDDGPEADQTCSEDDTGKKKGKKKADDDCEPPKPPPPPPVSLAGVRSPAPTAVDAELEAALANVGFLDTWYGLTLSNPRLSLVLTSGAEAEATRQTVLDHVNDLVTTREATTLLLNATQDTVSRRRMVERQIDVVDEQIASLVGQRLATIDTRTVLEGELARVLGALRASAVGMYVNDEQVTVSGISDVGTYNEQRELAERVDATIEELLAQRDELELRIATQEARIAELTTSIETREVERTDLEAQRDSLSETIAGFRDEITVLTAERVELETALPAAIGEAHTARMTASAPGLGISMVALDSYVDGVEQVTDFYPSCVIRWELLGGIATVESNHGTFGGAWVAANGKVSKRILGPVLDGTLEDTAVITDSDGGRLDGNAAYDRALGPFQFLPSTWRSFGLDGDGDGIADPHNMYDGALSAAGYLCSQSSVGSDAQIRRSVLTYNNSGQYLHDVTRFARNYIVSLGLPEAPYDPDELSSDGGWNIIVSESDEWIEIGQIGRPGADGDGVPGGDAGADDGAEVLDKTEDVDSLVLDFGLVVNTGD